MICTTCKRRLRPNALSCLCGWSASGAVPVRQIIACCFQGCLNPANVRLWTKTGWVNVCALVHSGKVETVQRVETNHHLEVLRAARRSRGNVVIPPYEREPGSDDEPINAASRAEPNLTTGQDRLAKPAGAAPDSDTLIAWSDRMISDAEADRMEP